jgi:hypothetical protein
MLRFQILLSLYNIDSQQLGRILHEEIGGSTMAWVRGLAEGDRQIFQTYVPRKCCS